MKLFTTILFSMITLCFGCFEMPVEDESNANDSTSLEESADSCSLHKEECASSTDKKYEGDADDGNNEIGLAVKRANYPNYARADEVLYYLGAALSESGKWQDAVQEYTRLVRTYPDSRFTPDAYLQLAEYYFDNNNAYKALRAYLKASAYRNSPKYSYALYKLAWCYYSVGEYGKAIDTMKTFVAYSSAMVEADEGGLKNRFQLQDEALKDLIRFFSDAGEMDEAYSGEYYSGCGKYERLADDNTTEKDEGVARPWPCIVLGCFNGQHDEDCPVGGEDNDTEETEGGLSDDEDAITSEVRRER